ncbi:hypothetical protein BOTBODRAFT_121970, partial [Botryobasidium botryosum FD-172 SS1]
QCPECHPDRLRCVACLISAHQHQPFHRLEQWQNGRFVPTSLADLGALYYIGHDGEPCPSLKGLPSAHKIQVAHVNGFHHLKVHYCVCVGAPAPSTQLLRARLFPGTLHSPKTAYMLEVLNYFRTLNLASCLTARNFLNTLARLTQPESPQDVQIRYDNFHIVVRFWRELCLHLQSGFALGIQAKLPAPYNKSMAVLCLPCPNPGINFPVKANLDPERPHLDTLFTCADANYRNVQTRKGLSDPLDFHLHPGAMFLREEEKYQEYLAEAVEETEASTCSGFKAGGVFKASKFKNVAVSGVFSCMCTHHGSFRPDATVDLQKGEKFINCDYAVAGSLQFAGSTPRVVHSYDVNCQYCRKMAARFAKRFPNVDLSVLKSLIPKWHASAHHEDCQYEFSFYYTPSVGSTDGEAPERNWAILNPLAPSAREMNTAHRHEVLDDHMNDINHQNMLSAGEMQVFLYISAF